MGSVIDCFWCEPTDRVRLQLRRFQFSTVRTCAAQPTGLSYCNACAPFGDHPIRWSKEHDGCLESYEDLGPAHDDPRWPKTCEACARSFDPEDQWQVSQEIIYRRVVTGAEFQLRDAPPGAMWDAGYHWDKGPDGISLAVALPPAGGFDHWLVDGPSKGGGRWTRSGTVPKVTANPSILTPRYHGWLRDGKLVEC